ncbi:hypothetical protein E4T49_01179 [Aureobasidium sp. EXF-10728]|nr:hypothetical protein E4T49_01179 [Aureobasidium sp. EXF-10728]
MQSPRILALVVFFTFILGVYSSPVLHERAVSKCTPRDIAIVRRTIKDEAYFCTWWLSDTRTRSPFMEFTPLQVTDSCKCISPAKTTTKHKRAESTEEATVEARLERRQSKTACRAELSIQFTQPWHFCVFYTSYPRTTSPFARYSAKELINLCNCVDGKIVSTSSKKTSTSTRGTSSSANLISKASSSSKIGSSSVKSVTKVSPSSTLSSSSIKPISKSSSSSSKITSSSSKPVSRTLSSSKVATSSSAPVVASDPVLVAIKNEFGSPLAFCLWWVGASYTFSSPIDGIATTDISRVCKSIKADPALLGQTATKAMSSPTGTSTVPNLDTLQKLVAQPLSFCKFWFNAPTRRGSPFTMLSAPMVSQVCKAVTATSTPVASSVSSSLSKSSSSTRPTSASSSGSVRAPSSASLATSISSSGKLSATSSQKSSGSPSSTASKSSAILSSSVPAASSSTVSSRSTEPSSSSTTSQTSITVSVPVTTSSFAVEDNTSITSILSTLPVDEVTTTIQASFTTPLSSVPETTIVDETSSITTSSVSETTSESTSSSEIATTSSTSSQVSSSSTTTSASSSTISSSAAAFPTNPCRSIYTDSASPPNSYDVRCNVDYFGGDLPRVTAVSLKACIDYCSTLAQCKAVVYNGNTCYAKYIVNPPSGPGLDGENGVVAYYSALRLDLPDSSDSSSSSTSSSSSVETSTSSYVSETETATSTNGESSTTTESPSTEPTSSADATDSPTTDATYSTSETISSTATTSSSSTPSASSTISVPAGSIYIKNSVISGLDGLPLQAYKGSLDSAVLINATGPDWVPVQYVFDQQTGFLYNQDRSSIFSYWSQNSYYSEVLLVDPSGDLSNWTPLPCSIDSFTNQLRCSGNSQTGITFNELASCDYNGSNGNSRLCIAGPEYNVELGISQLDLFVLRKDEEETTSTTAEISSPTSSSSSTSATSLPEETVSSSTAGSSTEVVSTSSTETAASSIITPAPSTGFNTTTGVANITSYAAVTTSSATASQSTSLLYGYISVANSGSRQVDGLPIQGSGTGQDSIIQVDSQYPGWTTLNFTYDPTSSFFYLGNGNNTFCYENMTADNDEDMGGDYSSVSLYSIETAYLGENYVPLPCIVAGNNTKIQCSIPGPYGKTFTQFALDGSNQLLMTEVGFPFFSPIDLVVTDTDPTPPSVCDSIYTDTSVSPQLEYKVSCTVDYRTSPSSRRETSSLNDCINLCSAESKTCLAAVWVQYGQDAQWCYFKDATDIPNPVTFPTNIIAYSATRTDV